jgi:DUF1009 family protein
MISGAELKTAKQTEPASTKSLALVAGEGKLPALMARSAAEKGYRVVALALSPEAAEQVKPHVHSIHLIAPGQLGRNIGILEKEGLNQIVFIGKIPKLNLLRNLHKLDWMAVKELGSLPDFNDDTIQRGMGNIMEARGIKVLTQREFLNHLFANVGLIGNVQPSAGEYADIEFGLKVAKEIARLDIGQTVVVKNQMILAIEAIEGTDEAIKRGVALAHGPVVVVKVAKFNHDPRFDTPTVGMSTLNAMICSQRGGVLAIESGQTLVVERDEMCRFANEQGIAFVAI